MERVTGANITERLARLARERRQALRDCGFPIFSLSSSGRPDEERLTGLERSDDTVTAVQLTYGDQRHGAWAVVETAKWAGTRVRSGSLRMLVEDCMRTHGDRISAVGWAEGAITVLVDGRPVAGRIGRAGDRWWAVRCEHDGVEISIAALGWSADPIAVATVTDLESLPSASPRQPRAATSAAARQQPAPIPDDLSREPLRGLVDIHLHLSRQQIEWRTAGGPQPQYPPYWSSLWQAAVQRQMALTDQPEPQAGTAVKSMLAQFSALYHGAAWFRDNNQLRERAVVETLMYVTGLNEDVASHGAQQAWQRRYRPRAAPPADYAAVEAGARAHQHWLDEWTAWADSQGAQPES